MEPIVTSFQKIHLQVRVSSKTFLLTTIYVSQIYDKRKKMNSFMELAPYWPNLGLWWKTLMT